MAQLSLTLLGCLQITLDSRPITAFESDKARALLAYLALEAERPHRRDALAGLLWPERPERAAHLSLNQALSNLRQVIGDRSATAPFLLITSESIQFDRVSDHTLDVATFSDLLAACDQHPHRHPESCTSCTRRLHQAVELYGGGLLNQFFLSDSAAFEEWALLKREQLHRRALMALAQLADYHERRGEHAPAERYTRRLLELDPWREQGHRQLMRVLARGGQRSAALMQYATCRRVLAEELGVEPEEETIALYEQIQRGAAPADGPATLPPTNLAAHTSPTPLIGRETELAQIADQLEQRDCRLLTLVGPGGIGKTRLALQAATDLRASYRDGACFAALAPLPAAEFVVPAIATALGFTLHGPADPKTQLLGYLRAKDMLLVLDNFEHLLTAALLVSELLAACPNLAVLATSRAPLHVRGEQQFPVPPLALPPVDDRRPTTDDKQIDIVGRRLSIITHYPAVQLFTQNAQAVQPNFALTAANAPDVATICARLDGLPLAIELAAARVKLLTPRALLTRLDQKLKLLTVGARDAPARHQTIRATIDWSYDLLDAGEQTLFARLDVFVGGCTLEAAETVCNADRDLPMSVLDGLAALVDKSLLQQVEVQGGEPRFMMLETIREYALERLAERGELTRLRQQHAVYYLALAEAAELELKGPLQQAWLEQLELELPNLRAVLAWSLREQGNVEIGLQLTAALYLFWVGRAYFREGGAWLEEVLGLPLTGLPPHPARAKALLAAADIMAAQHNLQSASSLLEESLALYRALGDEAGVTQVLWQLGSVAYSHGDYEQARLLEEESLAHSRRLGLTYDITWALLSLADVELDQGQLECATARLTEVLALCQTTGDQIGRAWALRLLGLIAYVQREYLQAMILLEQSLVVCRQLGNRVGVTLVHLHMGRVTCALGDIGQARQLLQDCLTFLHDAAMKWYIPLCLDALAAVASAAGQPAQAARLFGAAESLRESEGIPLVPILRAVYEHDVVATKTQMDATAFTAAWAEGQAMSVEQAIEEALQTASLSV